MRTTGSTITVGKFTVWVEWIDRYPYPTCISDRSYSANFKVEEKLVLATATKPIGDDSGGGYG